MIGAESGLHRPAGTLAQDGGSIVLTPETAGWRYTGMRLATLAPGASIAFDSASDEVAVVPLEGGFDVAVDGTAFSLHGRADVWAGPSDFIFAPPGSRVEIRGRAIRLAPEPWRPIRILVL